MFELINVSANRAVVDRSSDLELLMEILMVLQEVNPEMSYDIVEVENV
jgi:aspartate-semialdehyde dehydrogenase